MQPLLQRVKRCHHHLPVIQPVFHQLVYDTSRRKRLLIDRNDPRFLWPQIVIQVNADGHSLQISKIFTGSSHLTFQILIFLTVGHFIDKLPESFHSL